MLNMKEKFIELLMNILNILSKEYNLKNISLEEILKINLKIFSEIDSILSKEKQIQVNNRYKVIETVYFLSEYDYDLINLFNCLIELPDICFEYISNKFLNGFINLLFESKKHNGLIKILVIRIYRTKIIPNSINKKTKHLFEIMDRIKSRKYLMKEEIIYIKKNENGHYLSQKEKNILLSESLKNLCIKNLKEKPKEMKNIKKLPRDLRKYFIED